MRVEEWKRRVADEVRIMDEQEQIIKRLRASVKPQIEQAWKIYDQHKMELSRLVNEEFVETK